MWQHLNCLRVNSNRISKENRLWTPDLDTGAASLCYTLFRSISVGSSCFNSCGETANKVAVKIMNYCFALFWNPFILVPPQGECVSGFVCSRHTHRFLKWHLIFITKKKKNACHFTCSEYVMCLLIYFWECISRQNRSTIESSDNGHVVLLCFALVAHVLRAWSALKIV